MPAEAKLSVMRAQSTSAHTIGATLAQAFQDDPVFAWVVPSAASRRVKFPLLFEAFADFYLPHHETYIAGDGLAAALCAPPGVEAIAPDQADAFGERLSAILQEDLDRGLEVQALLEEHHPAQPCFYLQFMGVVPEQQGRGLGTRLLRTMLQQCDASATPAYLEATSINNRRLYERNGFETVGEIAIPAGPSLWPMWREPTTQKV